MITMFNAVAGVEALFVFLFFFFFCEVFFMMFYAGAGWGERAKGLILLRTTFFHFIYFIV